MIYQKTERLNLAKEYFHKAILLAREHQLISQLKTSLSALITFLININEFDNAKKTILELQTINDDFEYSMHLESSNLLKLFFVNKKMGITVGLDTLLYQGHQLALQSGSVSLQKEYAQELFNFQKHNGDVSDMIKYRDEYDSLLQLENQSKALAALRTEELRKSFEKKYAELLLNTSKIKKKNTTILLSLLSMTFVFSFLFILKLRQNTKIKKQKQKAQLNHTQIKRKYEEVVSELDRKQNLLAVHQLQKLKQKNRLVNTLEQSIKNKEAKEMDSDDLLKMLQDLKTGQDWIDFDIALSELNDSFYEKLAAIAPNLSVNEKRLCVFLKFEMTSKEIIAVTGQSLRAVEISRTRLRKKLGLTNQSIQLNKFLKDL